jgi:hypothetical protein
MVRFSVRIQHFLSLSGKSAFDLNRSKVALVELNRYLRFSQQSPRSLVQQSAADDLLQNRFVGNALLDGPFEASYEQQANKH